MPLICFNSLEELRKRISSSNAPLVVVPVHNAFAATARCLQSLIKHSNPVAEMLIIDDGSTEGSVAELVESLGDFPQSLYLWTQKQNIGFVRTTNQAFEVAGRRDVVLMNSDVVVGGEWLERLQAAACSREQIASATPLTNHGTVLSVPKGRPSSRILNDMTPEAAAVAVAELAARSYPVIPVCVGHLVYFRRFALDLAGTFDEAFSPGYSEEIDWALRCTALGLQHVCADDVFVYHSGAASFDPQKGAEFKERGHELIGQRYGFYYRWMGLVDTSEDTALAGAIACAEIALRGLRVLVDARNLEAQLRHGTHRLTVETIAALARHPRVSEVRVLLREPSAAGQLPGVAAEGARVRHMTESAVDGGNDSADIAFRPYQVHGQAEDLATLKSFAKRTIVWQLDLISFSNPFYHQDWERWHELRDLTRLALGTVDGVAVLSRDVLAQGQAIGVLDDSRRTHVLSPGIDHRVSQPEPLKPASIPQDETFSRFVLCLGTDYLHKNRSFSLRIFAHMKRRGYRYSLIKAGSSVPFGNSRKEEQDLVSELGLAASVLDLGIVPEAERRWLVEHADVVLYPSLAEGFGLVPFEAAAAGTPCLPSRLGALEEVLPEGIETIREWDADGAARKALALIDDTDVRNRQIEELRRRSAEFSWDMFANRFFEFAVDVCRSTPSRAVALLGESGNVIALRSPGPTVLRSTRQAIDRAVKLATDIGLASHPAVRPIRALLRLPYRALVRLSEGKISNPTRPD